ncbi:MAG: hypothetical protein AAGC64_14020 [Bacteroidota bacterium]
MRFLIQSILLLNFLLSSCDFSTKKASNNDNRLEEQAILSNAIRDEKFEINKVSTQIKKESETENTQNQKYPGLEEKLVGQICSYLRDFAEQERYYIPGGFLIGFGYGEEEIMNGRLFGITRIRGKKGDNKEYTTHLILKQSYEKKSIPCKIVDVLDVEKETDLFEKYPNKDLDVMTNVRVNGKTDTELLALAVYDSEEEILTEIYKLWRANRKTGKFEEIKDLTGVTVFNEDFD